MSVTPRTLQDLLRDRHRAHDHDPATYYLNDRPVSFEDYADAQIDYLSASELVRHLSDALEMWWVERQQATPRMTAKAGELTYENFLQRGWNDAMLVDHGYMEPRK